MKTLVTERDLDRMELEAEQLAKKAEKDFMEAFLGERGKRNEAKKQEVERGQESRLLE